MTYLGPWWGNRNVGPVAAAITGGSGFTVGPATLATPGLPADTIVVNRQCTLPVGFTPTSGVLWAVSVGVVPRILTGDIRYSTLYEFPGQTPYVEKGFVTVGAADLEILNNTETPIVFTQVSASSSPAFALAWNAELPKIR